MVKILFANKIIVKYSNTLLFYSKIKYIFAFVEF